MLKAREAPSAELERLRLMIPKSRSTTRKKGSPQARKGSDTAAREPYSVVPYFESGARVIDIQEM